MSSSAPIKVIEGLRVLVLVLVLVEVTVLVFSLGLLLLPPPPPPRLPPLLAFTKTTSITSVNNF